MTEFVWDNNKAAANWRDHGVTFQQAVKALNDHFFVEWIDDRENYGEEPVNLLTVIARDPEGVARALAAQPA